MTYKEADKITQEAAQKTSALLPAQGIALGDLITLLDTQIKKIAFTGWVREQAITLPIYMTPFQYACNADMKQVLTVEAAKELLQRWGI